MFVQKIYKYLYVILVFGIIFIAEFLLPVSTKDDNTFMDLLVYPFSKTNAVGDISLIFPYLIITIKVIPVFTLIPIHNFVMNILINEFNLLTIGIMEKIEYKSIYNEDRSRENTINLDQFEELYTLLNLTNELFQDYIGYFVFLFLIISCYFLYGCIEG